jgi:4-amino-4-deoxy-L-arabinose transferase-like glycosyltransferase
MLRKEDEKIQAKSPDQTANNPKLPFNLTYLLWLVLLFPLISPFLKFLNHSWTVLTWDWQIDYDEGVNFNSIRKIANFDNPYHQPRLDEFTGMPYPPVYHLLVAPFFKVFGANLVSGRVLALLASFTLAVLMGLFAHRLAIRYFRVSPINALLAGITTSLGWFSLSPVLIWSTFFKQDTLALALSTGGLFLLWLWDDKTAFVTNTANKRTGTRYYLYGSVILLTLAFYTKQDQLALSAVAIVYLLLKDRAKAWRFGLLLAGLILIPFALLTALTGGRFYFHVIEAQQAPFSFEDFTRRVFTRVVPYHLVIIFAGLLFVIIELMRAVQSWGAKKWYHFNLVAVWLGAATASLLTFGSYQKNYNHSLMFFVPLLIAVMAGGAWLIENIKFKTATGWQAFGLTVIFLIAFNWHLATYPFAGLYYSWGNMPSQTRLEMFQGISREIEQAPGDILSEDIYLQHKFNRPVYYDDLVDIQLQAQNGQWDETKFIEDLRNRRFSLVLLGLNSRRFTNRGWEALNHNYKLTFPDGISVWRPRAIPLAPQHSANCSAGNLKFGGVSYGRIHRNDTIRIYSYWQVTAPESENYTFFKHLRDATGKNITQRDEQPRVLRVGRLGTEPPTNQFSLLPTKQWQTGEWLILDHTLTLPPNFETKGTYRPTIGVYLIKPDNSITNLPLICGNNAPTNEVNLPPLKLNPK